MPLRLVACLMAMSTAFVPVATARADLLELTNGKVLAGRVTREDAMQVTFQTGTLSQGPKELAIPKKDIAKKIDTLDEAQRVSSTSDVATLRQWAAAYFYAGTETLADQCIRQALVQKATLADSPLGKGKADFRRFWNRTVLRERHAALGDGDTKTYMKLAGWAHEAGLPDETGQFVRRAWSLKRTSSEIRKRAARWGVKLESWARVDPSPGLDMSLFMNGIQDEGINVAPAEGKAFLYLPIRYDTGAGPRILSKATLPRKLRDAFYGIRLLRQPPQAARLEAISTTAIYERVELKAADSSAFPEIVARNTLGPRVDETGTAEQPRVRRRADMSNASGFAVLVLEVPRETVGLALDWGDGGSDEIDLAYLRDCRKPLLDMTQRLPGGAVIQASLDRLKGNSTIDAELALRQLGRVRVLLGSDELEAWSTEVDPKVIASAGRIEAPIRQSAFAYFSELGLVSKAACRAVARRSPGIKSNWIDLIRAHADVKQSSHRKAATELLCAVLKSDDEDICHAALELLLDIDPDIDWAFVGDISTTAQLATLARLEQLDHDKAIAVLFMMMKSVRAESADQLAVAAHEHDLTLTDPGDPILKQWPGLDSSRERVALLTVLRSVRLGDLAYCEPMVSILESALADDSPRVRSAASALVVWLTASWQDNPSFPVLGAAPLSDPIVRSLFRAATSGPYRIEALVTLLNMGLFREARRALADSGTDTQMRDRLLQQLMAMMPNNPGLLALLGRMLHPDYQVHTDQIFKHLNRAFADSQATDRWQILAAIKAGVDFKALAELTDKLEPTIKVAANRWLTAICHLTPQDRRRLIASQDTATRIQNLERFDVNRGQLVDGRYGVLAIIETVELGEDIPVTASGTTTTVTVRRWNLPRRRTVVLPSLILASNLEDNAYRVFWGKQQIGEGLVNNRVPDKGAAVSFREPAAFSPRLGRAGKKLLGSGGWGWPDPSAMTRPGVNAVGPEILDDRPVLSHPVSDTMTLNLSAYLRAGLIQSEGMSRDTVIGLVPDDYQITLRYAAFASYYGVGVRRPLPEDAKPGHRHLMNVMIVVERMDL